MGSATLFLLDAPRVKTRSAANAFVERWEEAGDGKLNKAIAAFLDDVRNELSGPRLAALWYEGPPAEPVAKPLLQLDLSLDVLDGDMLRLLRTVAERHKLHLFDAEGEALYLSDGSEVSAESLRAKTLPPSIPTQEVRSAEGLRFDGVYAHSFKGGTTFFRFTPDGEMYRLSDVNPNPKRAFLDMTRAQSLIAYGKWTFLDGHVQGSIRSSNGTFRVKAKIEGDRLVIHSIRTDGAYSFTAPSDFKPVR
jgi:hypothetical protein